MSPYMIGPYYKPQLTSVLSIISRMTGIYLTAITLPLLLWWALALMSGPDAFATMYGFLSGYFGKALLLGSVICLSYHFMNGLRHLIWDMGKMMQIDQVYRSGWIMVLASLALTVFVYWAAP